MRKSLYILILLFVALLNACVEEGADIAPIAAGFDAAEITLEKGTTSANMSVHLSRISQSNNTILLDVAATGLEYGVHFLTDPEITDGTIALEIPKGKTEAMFSLSKLPNIVLDGTENIRFSLSLASVSDHIEAGEYMEVMALFEAITPEDNLAKMTLEGNSETETGIYTVYVDLSEGIQTAVSRKNWNLGFYCGDRFRVVLNDAYATVATSSAQNDITQVTLADAEQAVNIAADPETENLPADVVDAFNGSITNTAFAAVSDIDEENMVYFVASEDNKSGREEWYKVRVNRKDDGYTVQYARVGDPDFKTVDIAKNVAYNFVFLSLETGELVSAEPPTKNWDISWGHGTVAENGNPHFREDVVFINDHGEIGATRVLESSVAFLEFNLEHTADLSFSSVRNIISDDWRQTTTDPVGVRTDRYYIIKEQNRYYKLRFTAMGLNDDGTERGRPMIEYQLLK